MRHLAHLIPELPTTSRSDLLHCPPAVAAGGTGAGRGRGGRRLSQAGDAVARWRRTGGGEVVRGARAVQRSGAFRRCGVLPAAPAAGRGPVAGGSQRR
jgi:hypothetical protein